MNATRCVDVTTIISFRKVSLMNKLVRLGVIVHVVQDHIFKDAFLCEQFLTIVPNS